MPSVRDVERQSCNCPAYVESGGLHTQCRLSVFLAQLEHAHPNYRRYATNVQVPDNTVSCSIILSAVVTLKINRRVHN